MNKLLSALIIIFLINPIPCGAEDLLEDLPDYKIAVEFYKKNNFQDAVYSFKKLETGLKDRYQLYIYIGNSYKNLNKLDEALLHYNLAIKEQPDNSYIAKYNKAFILFHQKKITSAIELLKEVVQANSHFAFGYYNLGTMLLINKENQEAVKYLTKACDLIPESTACLYNLAIAHHNLNNNTLAKQYFSRCIEINPKDIDAIDNLKKLDHQL